MHWHSLHWCRFMAVAAHFTYRPALPLSICRSTTLRCTPCKRRSKAVGMRLDAGERCVLQQGGPTAVGRGPIWDLQGGPPAGDPACPVRPLRRRRHTHTNPMQIQELLDSNLMGSCQYSSWFEVSGGGWRRGLPQRSAHCPLPGQLANKQTGHACMPA